jgi:hypothetical protein
MLEPTRRDFLKTSMIAGAAVALGEFTLRGAQLARPGGTIPFAPSWADKPMR